MNLFSRAKKTPTASIPDLVSAAVDSVLRGTKADVKAAWGELDMVRLADLLPELLIRVDVVTAGADLDTLMVHSVIPLPDFQPREVVAAVRARDMEALLAATHSPDLTGVAIALLQLIVSFEGSRERL